VLVMGLVFEDFLFTFFNIARVIFVYLLFFGDIQTLLNVVRRILGYFIHF
jgi:hypothetical protein